MALSEIFALEVEALEWPLKKAFVIARGAKVSAPAVRVTISDTQGCYGRGEGCPYPRYGETLVSVFSALEVLTKQKWSWSALKNKVISNLSPSAANALDCAMLDYQANHAQQPVSELLELSPLREVKTAMTIGLGSVQEMQRDTEQLVRDGASLLKLKLGGDEHSNREAVSMISQQSASCELILDGNEGMSAAHLPWYVENAKKMRVVLIEQPLPADNDQFLRRYKGSGLLCADESFRKMSDFSKITPLYDVVNIKLDKCGGLNEGIALARQAKKNDLKVMIGCMVGSSLAIAPALHLQGFADFIDLDGPIFLERDIEPSMVFEQGNVSVPPHGLWGCGRGEFTSATS